jgi:hypothetical protein
VACRADCSARHVGVDAASTESHARSPRHATHPIHACRP